MSRLIAAGLGRRYRRGRDERWALRGVDLVVEPQTVLGVVGESGAGKSTLARLLAGWEAPDEGRVSVGGQDVRPLQPGLSRADPLSVRYLPQDASASIHPDMTVADALAEPHRVQARPVPSPGPVLEAFQLPTRALDRSVRTLSTGQRQRLALARSLALPLKALVLDEPFSAQDAAGVRALLDVLHRQRVRRSFSVVVVSHALPWVVSMADEVAVLFRGAVVEQAPAQQWSRARKHPYAQDLWRHVVPHPPDVDHPWPPDSRLAAESAPSDWESGCPFATSCPLLAQSPALSCATASPPWVSLSEGGGLRCHAAATAQAEAVARARARPGVFEDLWWAPPEGPPDEDA